MFEMAEADGLKFLLRPNTSDRVVFEDNILRHSYEKHGVIVEAGQAWMDVGGYIGTFTVNLLQKGASVVTYEPDPDNAKLCFNNLALNGFNSYVFEMAVVATEQEQMPLYKNTYKGNMAANTLFPHWKTKRPSVMVECIKFAEAFKQSLDLLDAESLSVKLDCEGSEIEILEQMDLTLPIDQITMEYHFSVSPNCERYWAIVKRLESVGFKVKASAKVPESGDWKNFRQQTIQVYCTR